MSEMDVTWSSIEKDYSYSNVMWHMLDNGIPTYVLLNENGEKIDINFDEAL